VATVRQAPKVSNLIQPMLASPGDRAPAGEGWAYEPKYDGIRVICLVAPDAVALMTRNGYDKAAQFPEVARALKALAARLRRNLVLDGEIVALDHKGNPARFEALQGRMQLRDESSVRTAANHTPAAIYVFDLLVHNDELLVDQRWDDRRKRLVKVMKSVVPASKKWLRLTEAALETPDELLREALANGWEGIIAKRRDGRYDPGRRVKHWQKIKLEHQQEFVVAGWTNPRNSRQHLGALLLGYYDKNRHLRYAGSVGTGFTDKALADIARKLKAIERDKPAFTDFPAELLSGAHFVAPKFVAQVRFNEWTSGGLLRHPAFLGLRDDKPARQVTRERTTPRTAAANNTAHALESQRPPSKSSNGKGQSGVQFTNLDKVFFPVPRVTKGRLLQYYADISPWLLPALRDRPLVLKRYPNGIAQEAFYQHKALTEPPAGVRAEEVVENGDAELRYIGGDLPTLLYVVQLGAISTDPWHSRVQSSMHADYSIVDLDPGPTATFKRVVQVARWVKEELDELGLHAVPKTSGASGIHVVLPLPRGASYEISRVLAELVARRVNEKHPKETTVVRGVRQRPQDAVYVDYLQNIRGKTVASVYSARAETYATASTPLKWKELTSDLSPLDFTIENLVQRAKRVGDIWADGMRRPNRLPGIIGDAAA
jgi:bifunctional non-homologous end joining protein LigD